MNKKDESNWLNDAFDDKKTEEDIELARRSRNIGCLIGALVLIVVFIIVLVVGCSMVGSLFV